MLYYYEVLAVCFSACSQLLCLRVCLIPCLPVSKELSWSYDGISFSLLPFVAPTGPPVNITVVAVNSSSVSVGWIKPDKGVLHGKLVRYEVEHRRVHCNESDPVSVTDGSWQSVNVTNTSSHTEIGSLAFWSCYEVRMRAVTVGNGPYSDVLKVRTKEDGE